MFLNLMDRPYKIVHMLPAAPGWRAYYVPPNDGEIESEPVRMWAIANIGSSGESKIVPVVFDMERLELAPAPACGDYIGVALDGAPDALERMEMFRQIKAEVDREEAARPANR